MTQMDSDNGNILIRVGVTAASLRNSNSKLCDDNYTKTCIQSSNRLINKILLLLTNKPGDFYVDYSHRRIVLPTVNCAKSLRFNITAYGCCGYMYVNPVPFATKKEEGNRRGP